jgi:hypothetical protein
MTKIAGSGSVSESESGSGSISQRHGSADPDPHHNVMDPEYCFLFRFKTPVSSTVTVRSAISSLSYSFFPCVSRVKLDCLTTNRKGGGQIKCGGIFKYPLLCAIQNWFPIFKEKKNCAISSKA